MFSFAHLHPMLVHFPIALILIGFVADIISIYYHKNNQWSTLGFYLLIIGTLSAIAALISGTLFTSEMEGAAHDVQETHELFAWITVINLIILSAFRIYLKVKDKERATFRWVAFIWYGVVTITVSITGFYGGTLVYNYMMPI